MDSHRVLFLTLALLSNTPGLATADDDEHPNVSTSSQAFEQGYDAAIKRLERSGFEDRLESFSFGAENSENIDRLAAEIKKEDPIPTALGDPGIVYDVILQPGHYGRPPGKLGTSGKRVSERALVAYIAVRVARRLQADHLSVLLIKADHFTPGLKAHIYLTIHADGNDRPCVNGGPSLAYSPGTSPYAMHAIGWSLAAALGYSYKEFKKDNYTANERDYYMFNRLDATAMKGLLEIGELTCPAVEERLIATSPGLANNLAAAIEYLARTEAPTP